MTRLQVTLDGCTYEVDVEPLGGGSGDFTVRVGDETLCISLPTPDRTDWFLVDGRSYEIRSAPDLHWVQDASGIHSLKLRCLEQPHPAPRGSGQVKAPIPGQISRVLVEPGEQVQAGQAVIVLEAMKMGNELRAGRAGRVAAVYVRAGDAVSRGQALLEID